MPSLKKIRLDQLLVSRGHFASRHQAQIAIRSGQIITDNSLSDKPGRAVSPGTKITIKKKPRYKSRGGEKLEFALKEFSFPVAGKIALDIGCSTGGFTDCLLQHGAVMIYAVDVGYGQLDLSLRSNPKIVVMEKTNARYLQPDKFPVPPEIITVDVSFISLEKILPVVSRLLAPKGCAVVLIKPQFEAGPGQAPKGVVRNPVVHEKVITRIKKTAADSGLKPQGVIPSPLLGPKGNREFLLYLIKT